MKPRSFHPYGGTGKKQRKVDRLSMYSEVIAVTLDKKWGMIRRRTNDDTLLFIELQEFNRGTTKIRLYQMNENDDEIAPHWIPYPKRTCGFEVTSSIPLISARESSVDLVM